MDAIVEELDRLRAENKALHQKVDRLTLQLQGAERAAALAGSLDHSLDLLESLPGSTTREDYLRGILVPGTPIYNRFYLADEFEREFRRNTRSKTELSCVMLHIDTDCDDACLRALAELLHNHLRIEDVLGLWEERTLMLVLSRTNADTAMALADYLRSLPAEAPALPDLTMSGGIADLRAGMPRTPAEMLENAAEALQLAREMGGDRSVIFNRLPL